MRTFSIVYMIICLGIQLYYAFTSPLNGPLSFLSLLSLPMMFMLQGIWAIYVSGNNREIKRKIIFWWLVGFLPIAAFMCLSVYFGASVEFLIPISALLFFVAVIRIIWIGARALSERERQKFGEDKWHPIITGLCLYFLIPGIFFLYNRAQALKA